MTGMRIQSFRADAGRIELFVSDCASCGTVFGMAAELEARRREDRGTFYCPNGHQMVFNGKTKLEREADAAKAEAARLRSALLAQRDQANAAREEAAAARAAEVRLRWRIGNGVCPCCNRSFPALAAHVATKHPEFTGDLDGLSTRMRELLASIRAAVDEHDQASVSIGNLGANRATLNALERRGLVERVGWARVALTETGWPLSEAVAR